MFFNKKKDICYTPINIRTIYHIMPLPTVKTEILLVPPKCKLIMALSNYEFLDFAIAILYFSLLLLVKLSLLMSLLPF